MHPQVIEIIEEEEGWWRGKVGGGGRWVLWRDPQVIEIIEEEEGWWRGKVGALEGVFPSNL